MRLSNWLPLLLLVWGVNPLIDEFSTLLSPAGRPIQTTADIPEATVADAVMMLDLRDTGALFFKNAGTGRHNMVYRRRDGTIGWVEPS